MSDEPTPRASLLGAYWLDSAYWHPGPCCRFDRPEPLKARAAAGQAVRTALTALACVVIVAALAVTYGRSGVVRSAFAHPVRTDGVGRL